MEFEQALEVTDAVVFAQVGRHLSDVEIAILRGTWQKQTYEQIAEASGYSISYLTRDVGPKLWKLLSQALGEAISKSNFRAALEQQWRKEDRERGSRAEGEQGRGGARERGSKGEGEQGRGGARERGSKGEQKTSQSKIQVVLEAHQRCDPKSQIEQTGEE